ncbi:MAG: glycosyltransferase family 4 protein [Phycisphaeraceae bacterium JB051]
MPQSQSSLRILHLTAGSDLGGVSRYLLDICRATQQNGHEVTIAGQQGAWHEAFLQTNIKWVEAPMAGDLLTLRRTGRNLGRLLENEHYDLICAHYRKSAMVGRQLARQWDIPMLFTLHLTDIPMSLPWRWLSDFGDHAHAPSKLAKEWLMSAAKLTAQQITVVPHGVDTQHFLPATPSKKAQARTNLVLPPDRTIGGYIGRFDVPKNHMWLIDLAIECRKRLPEVMILMAGDGPDTGKLRDALYQNQLFDHLRILSYRDPLMLYHAVDALLLPSAAEGFSLSCCEAMSCGLPVLRTQTAGYHEQIVEGVTGVSVPVDHDTFIEESLSFLADQQRLIKMGEQAADHVRESLRFDQQVAATLELYQRLTGRS